jgi:hypothetical protein
MHTAKIAIKNKDKMTHSSILTTPQCKTAIKKTAKRRFPRRKAEILHKNT